MKESRTSKLSSEPSFRTGPDPLTHHMSFTEISQLHGLMNIDRVSRLDHDQCNLNHVKLIMMGQVHVLDTCLLRSQ